MDRQAVLQLIEQAASEQASELNLSGLGLMEVPMEIGQLVNLRELDLSGNQINIIPDEIGQLINLEHLDLRNNQIIVIPEAIGQLVNLQRLYLTHNQISVVPRVIGRLVNLQRLALRNNQISVIPEAIGQLVSLQRLSFSRNQISVVPEVIGQLVNLKILLLKDNPDIDIPPEIIRKGWGEDEAENGNPQAIFAYLKAYRQSAAKRPLNELKVLLVGEGAVGKTSLLKRLTDESFDAAERKTPGINIKSWRFKQGDQSVRYNFWDFGGQKVMHSTHQFFFTKRSLYLLVLDNRKSEAQNRVEYWLKLIETYGSNSPIIIVGNCSDQNPRSLRESFLKKKYPQIKQFISTSCLTGQGLPELRKVIDNQIDSIPHVRDLLPVAWFNLKLDVQVFHNPPNGTVILY